MKLLIGITREDTLGERSGKYPFPARTTVSAVIVPFGVTTSPAPIRVASVRS